jgi:hypothetical protein
MGNWTPSIVPNVADQTVYMVVDDLGHLGEVWREAGDNRVRVDSRRLIRPAMTQRGPWFRFGWWQVAARYICAEIGMFRLGGSWPSSASASAATVLFG